MITESSGIRDEAKQLLLRNRKIADRHQFTMPSPYEYRHQWLWDSCFHAIALRHFDVKAAENELISLLASQKSSGFVPHESKYRLFGIPLPYTSRITQPAFIARAALDVYNKSRNRSFLTDIFPKLHLYHKWLEKERESNNVLKVVNPNESGEDNSILWDSYLPLPLHRTYGWLSAYLPMPQLPHIKSVTATSVYADALECMAEIAKVLRKKELHKHYETKRNTTVAAMAQFRHDDGIYYSLTSNNTRILSKTHSIFSPLFAAAITKKDAKQLVNEHMLNEKEFWTACPIPTVPVSEKKFSQKGYWRGPMWVNLNWMLYRGLLRYGFSDTAQQLLQKTVAAVKKSGFREYYNPITGDGLGAKAFAWSTLVMDMMDYGKY